MQETTYWIIHMFNVIVRNSYQWQFRNFVTVIARYMNYWIMDILLQISVQCAIVSMYLTICILNSKLSESLSINGGVIVDDSLKCMILNNNSQILCIAFRYWLYGMVN